MKGQDYRATVRLTTKADETLAEPGDSCERVPAVSLPWLLEQGLIVPVRPTPARVAPTKEP